MRRRWSIALMLAPAVAGVGGLFVAALALGALRSFGVTPFAAGSAPTLHHFARALAEPGLGASVLLTLSVAVVVAALSTILGIAAALLLHRAIGGGRGGRATALLFQLNLTVPHVVAAVGMGALLAQSGLVARVLHAAGAISQPSDFPALTQDPWALGIVATYLWKEIPFVGAVVLSLLAGTDDRALAVARTLGASPWQAFRHVTLPAILPGATAAAAMVFAYTMGAYEVPSVLGASHPKMLPVLATELFTSSDIDDRPAAVALSLLLAAASLSMIVAWRSLAPRPPVRASRR